MAQEKAGKMRIVLSALALCMVAQQSLYNNAQAGMITGIAPEIGADGNKIYNIDPSVINGDIGFRLYEEFQLNKGEIANLIFKYYGSKDPKDIKTFVNLVDNKIDINGLVNTMRDGNFYNGHAIFVSPNGMVVGASGVLNVGSLTVLTPEQNNYNKFKSDYDIKGPLGADTTDLYTQGTGTVTIDGKVISRDLVDIRAAGVDINNSIIAGVGNNKDVLTTHSQADVLFNSLVNTDNMKAGNSFASDSGNIKITAYSGNDGINLAEGSTLKNFGKGNIELTSMGSKGIVADGDIKNPNGNVLMQTTQGSIDISGDVQNKNGNIIADSANGIYLAQSGSMKNENGNIELKNRGTKGINIKGSIENKTGNLLMDNYGQEGIILDGAPITNKGGDIEVINRGEGGTTVNGTVTNIGGNSTYTNEAGALTVNGKVNNEGGNLKFDNTGTGIDVNYDADISNQGGNLEMLNTGVDGIQIAQGATVNNETGNTIVTNSGLGGISVGGSVLNTDGDSTYTNEAGGFIVDGSIANTNGDLLATNNGEGGFTINGLASNIGGNSTYTNTQGGMTVNGNVKNEGGNLKLDNSGTGISINDGALVSNKNGNLDILNTGADGILLEKNGTVTNENTEENLGNLNVYNSGDAGMNLFGDITNINGDSIYTNEAGGINVAGNILNKNGDLSVTNKGKNGISISGKSSNENGNSTYINEAGGFIVDGSIANTNGDLLATNNGEGGFTINGLASNIGGNSTYTNTQGGMTVNGNVKNEGGNLKLDNSGTGISINDGALVSNKNGNLDILNTGADGILLEKNGTVTNENTEENLGNLNVYNSGDAGMNLFGDITNINGDSIYTNEAGGINVAGNILNKNGDLSVTNKGKNGISISGKSSNENGNSTYINEAGGFIVDGSIANTNGDLLATNNGEGGFTINGLASNIGGNSTYTNTQGGMTVNGNVKNEGGDLKLDNTGTGISVNDGASIFNKDGNLNMLNTGADGIFVDKNAAITNDNGNMYVSNSGEGGLTINGVASNTKGNAEFNNSNGFVNINGKISNNDKLLAIKNTGDGLNINKGAFVDSEGQLLIDNSGIYGMNISGRVDSKGNADIINSNGNLNINTSADINHKSVENNYINISNSGNKLYIDGNIDSENGKMNISNRGEGGLHIDKNGTITDVKVEVDSGDGDIKYNHTPEINISNDSVASMDIDGTINSYNNHYNIVNAGKGGININETANINGVTEEESAITNFGDGGIKIAGNITSGDPYLGDIYGDAGLTIKNDNAVSGIHVTETGNINSKNIDHTYIYNNGEKGIVVDGKINQNYAKNTPNSLKIVNTGKGGVNLTSTGRINNSSSTYIENSGKDGIKFAGLTKTNGLTVNNKDSNVVIGDETNNDKYITSGGDVKIAVNNGSILNYGVNKTLINIENSALLNMSATDGTIGLDDGNCGSACIGVGPDSRDFTKSINVTSDGAITATTTQDALTDDLVINIAGKNSDLNIDQVKADGKVILTTADFDENNKGYSILNASTDSSKANIEGKGIALIASDKIGEADNKLTFNQTAGKFNMEGYDLDNLTYQPNAEYGMDVLAINDINIKGQDDKYDTNVCTMISREGSINAEFSGNTYIREVTADKELNLVTRGAEFVIDNLGTVPYTPEDYFGPNGNNAPDTVIVKALDINPNTRVDDAGLVDGVHSHWADSHIIIKNGKVDDNAKIVLTGDNVYAGGYRFYMGKDRNEDGKTYWVYDDRTAMTDMSGNGPTIRVNAVREDDVTSIGRQEEERNYYTGGSVQEDEPWYGDDDDDDDHLIVPEPGDDDDDDQPDPPVGDDDDDDQPDPPVGDDDDDDQPDPPVGDDDDDDQPDPPVGDDDDDDQPDPPVGDDDDDDQPDPPVGDDDDDDQPDPPVGDDDDDDQPDPPVGDDDDDDQPDPPVGDDDDDDDLPVTRDDAKRTWKKIIADDVNIIDKRQYIRFRVAHNPNPVVFESVPTVSSLVDISRGGVALTHSNALKVGDIVPVHIKYGDLDIDADVKVVTASDRRAGAEFVNLDQSTANRLLYLNLMLEEDQKLTLGGNNQI